MINTIYNKSFLDASTYELPLSYVDMIVTSPPYYNLKEYAVWKDYDCYLNFIFQVLECCYDILRPGGWLCWNIQDCIPFPHSRTGKERYCQPLFAQTVNFINDIGFLYEKDIVWYKGKGTATQKLFGSYNLPGLILCSGLTEHIITARKPRGDYKREIHEDVKEKSKLTKKEWGEWAVDLWNIHPESAKRIGHPAPYPIEIPYRLIRMNTFVGDTVLDPFMGSGTTALAAKRCSRNYIGYEIHKEYIDIAEGRLRADIDIFED